MSRPPYAWAAAGAARIGASHLARDIPCQDAGCVWHGNDGTIIAAIADGAGSASNAAKGSFLATRAAARYIHDCMSSGRNPMPEELLNEAFHRARASIEEEVQKANDHDVYSLRSFATTLVVAVWTPRWFAAGQRGDGAVVIRDAAGELQTLVKPQNGTYANQTYFLTDPVDQILSDVVISEPVPMFALMTDGLTPLALVSPDDRPHPGFFEPIERFISSSENRAQASRDLGDFLKSDRVNSRTDDDKTLYLAMLRPDRRAQA